MLRSDTRAKSINTRWEDAFEEIVIPGVAGRTPQAHWLPDLGQDLAGRGGARLSGRVERRANMWHSGLPTPTPPPGPARAQAVPSLASYP